MKKVIELDYKIPFYLPEHLKLSWNYITESDCLDITSYVKQIKIKDSQSLVVLWGAGHRINVHSENMAILNDFYSSIDNPMILVNGEIYQDPQRIIKFPYAQPPFFQYWSKHNYKNIEFNQQRTKKFLFASTKDYPSRRYLLASLYQHGLIDQGHVAYKCLMSAQDYDFYPQEFLSHCSTVDHLLPLLGFDHELPEGVVMKAPIALDCVSAVATETFLSVAPGNYFFSEKLFNSMMFKQIFFYLGPVNSLQYIRSLGFKTFAHVIDESYDSIVDNVERIKALNSAMVEFLSQPAEKIQQIYSDNQSILDHNYDLVNQTDLSDSLTNSFLQAIAVK